MDPNGSKWIQTQVQCEVRVRGLGVDACEAVDEVHVSIAAVLGNVMSILGRHG